MKPVLAAGALCWRITAKGRVKVLLVDRPGHRDTSLPKGKVDPGETLPETAVREIAEETGLIIGLGTFLGIVEYRMPNGRDKHVYYWAAEVSTQARANSTFAANDEIEKLHWVTLEKARTRLSYPHDVDILDRFAELYEQGRARTFAIIALRHGKAEPGSPDGTDASRPLASRGVAQAASIAHGVAAYRPARLISSPAARTMATIAPTARVTGLDVTESTAISESKATPDAVEALVATLVEQAQTTVLCSHGPVLPWVVSAAVDAAGGSNGVRTSHAAGLATAEFMVIHIPVEKPGTGIVAVESHLDAV